MQRTISLLLLGVSLSCLGVGASQVNKSPLRPADDHVIVERRRLVILRSAELAENPEKRRAVVIYPIVSGLSPAILRRVRSLLDFKNIFDYSLQEYREDTWLREFTFKVNHNANHLFDITFTQDGSGAYPDTQDKHLLINLRDGRVIKAVDAFDSARLSELASAVDQRLQAELKQIDKENADTNSEQAEERDMRREAYEALKFERKDLDEFSVSPKGVTFLYDAGFPHVIRALEPEGRYFFTYAELKPLIKPDGPLGQFVR